MFYQPATTWTGVFLSVQSAVYLFLFHAYTPSNSLFWIELFFVFSFLGFLAGIVLHGFYNDNVSSKGGIIANFCIRLCAAGMSCALGMIAGIETFNKIGNFVWHIVWSTLVIAFLLYVSIRFFQHNKPTSFYWASLLGAIAILLLIAGSIRDYLITGNTSYELIILGSLLAILASVLQALKISISPKHFNHNALYHVIMIFVLHFLYIGYSALI